jgi:hypothetical protein
MTDTFRKEYKPLSDEQKQDIEVIKEKADELLSTLNHIALGYSIDVRMLSLAKTNLEQAVMWAIKSIT